MAPRESNALFNWLGATNGNFATAATGKQQLFHATMLPLWLATVLTREDLCVAILCGAPCSGKSEAARRMAAIFGDLLAVVSDDLACDAQQAPDGKDAHPQSEFDSVIQSVHQKPRVVVYDDGNVQFQDYAAKVTSALAAGVKLQNFAWFVFDQGLSENEEVEHLMSLQQKRLQNFWKSTKEGGVVTTPSYASDGKVTTPDVVRRAVRNLRKQYFMNSELRLFNAEWITQELLEFAQSLQGSGSLDTFPSALMAALASTSALVPAGHTPSPDVLSPISPSDAVSTGPGLATLPAISPLPLAPHASLPTGSAHSVLGISSLGGTAMHPNAVPNLGLPPDQTNSLASDHQPWDQPITPLYFVFANGHNASGAMPLQLQFNCPSSAAAPPFTVTSPTTSSGEQTAAPATQVTFDDTSLAYALCFSHRPTSGQHGATFREDLVHQSPGPVSQSSAFKSSGTDLLMNGKVVPKAEKRGRKDPKGLLSNGCSGYQTNGHTNGHSQTNGHGALPSNGHSNGGSTNGHSNGQKGAKHSKASKNGHAEAKGRNGKKKPHSGYSGWAAGGAAPFMNGGLTLRSVLNEYWKSHKMELDGNSDFDLKVPAELLAKSSMSLAGMDEASVLSSLQALIEDADEEADSSTPSTPSPPQSL